MLNATPHTLRPTGTSRIRFGLDVSAQPFLADHRVGSRAILSTVMSLEAMGEAALTLEPGSAIRSVSELVKRSPLFVSDGAPAVIEVELEVVAETDTALRCRIVSDPDASAVLHDEALVHLAPGLTGPKASGAPADRPVGQPGPSIDQTLIYELFFHGPSFQIIGSAHLQHGALVATLAADLPPLVDAQTPSALAPRLIELCLQGAGLLELTSTGRMMIPRSIDQVARHSDVDCDSGLTLRAVVRRRLGEDTDGPMVFDAAVLDEADRVHLEVLGYRTAPYDQPVDDAAVAAIVTGLSA